MKKIKILAIILFSSFITNYNSFAQQDIKFEELKDSYFRDKKYAEFTDYLKSLGAKNKELEPAASYYIGLSRYHQLKYLEETQDWNEYFSQGNSYREEISSYAQKAIDSTKQSDALHIYARLLLWQFHKDQQDAFAQDALSGLKSSVLEYAKQAQDIKPIKDVADKLLSYQEKGESRQLYRIYVDKIISSDIKDGQLKEVALGFYEENNVELSQVVYDSYIDKILKSLPKEKSAEILIDIARQFAYKKEGASDMLYAERVFKKLEETGGKEIFNEELMYMRAFNLEKAKEFLLARDRYMDLSKAYPESTRLDEANYKIGVIYSYLSKDIKEARQYFEKLAQKETLSPHVLSSLYQLGLLSQWEGEFDKAKGYYNELIEKAAGGFTETVTPAKERLKEIDEQKPIEYNLKAFLDACLKEDSGVAMTSNLNASTYILNKDEEAAISSNTNLPISGCLPVELQYLWSGRLGKPKTAVAELPLTPSFNTSYLDTGTKEINLAVLSASGVIDCSIDMVDVY